MSLKADSIFQPSLQLLEKSGDKTINSTYTIDDSIKNVRVTIKDIYIKKKGELSKAEVYFYSVVTDHLMPVELKSEIYENIGKNQALPLGPSGVVIYRNKEGKLPKYLDIRIAVMESDEKSRNLGKDLESIRESDEFKKAKDAVLAVTSLTAPHSALVTASVDFIFGLVSKALQKNKDDQFIYIMASFDSVFDDLGTRYGEIVQENKYVKIKYQVEAV